jgi:hypothetical protein
VSTWASMGSAQGVMSYTHGALHTPTAASGRDHHGLAAARAQKAPAGLCGAVTAGSAMSASTSASHSPGVPSCAPCRAARRARFLAELHSGFSFSSLASSSAPSGGGGARGSVTRWVVEQAPARSPDHVLSHGGGRQRNGP